MKVTINVSQQDLDDLEITAAQLAEGVAEKLNGGINIEQGVEGVIYLNDLTFDVVVGA